MVVGGTLISSPGAHGTEIGIDPLVVMTAAQHANPRNDSGRD